MNELDDCVQLYQLKMIQCVRVTRPWNLHRLGRDIGKMDGICTLELITEKSTFTEIIEDYPAYEMYLTDDEAKLGRFTGFELEPGYLVTFIDLTLDSGRCILLTADYPEWLERDNPQSILSIYRGYDWNIYMALDSWFAMHIDDNRSEKWNTCIQISSGNENGGFGLYKLKIKKEE